MKIGLVVAVGEGVEAEGEGGDRGELDPVGDPQGGAGLRLVDDHQPGVALEHAEAVAAVAIEAVAVVALLAGVHGAIAAVLDKKLDHAEAVAAVAGGGVAVVALFARIEAAIAASGGRIVEVRGAGRRGVEPLEGAVAVGEAAVGLAER